MEFCRIYAWVQIFACLINDAVCNNSTGNPHSNSKPKTIDK
jgi:hypothetical protein